MGNGSTALFDAARSRNLAVVRSLLDAGADVNTATKRRETVLGVAAMQGSEDIVNLLLERGAEVNVRDERGYSPLMYAAYSEAMPAGIVRTLLAKGADTSITGEGETAQSLASKRGDNEVARLLGVPELQRRSGGVAPIGGHSAGSRPVAEAVQTGTLSGRKAKSDVPKTQRLQLLPQPISAFGSHGAGPRARLARRQVAG